MTQCHVLFLVKRVQEGPGRPWKLQKAFWPRIQSEMIYQAAPPLAGVDKRGCFNSSLYVISL